MPTRIWIAPFSGGAFMAQLALMILALENQLTPDVCMGCSGGNFSCYLCFANGFDPAKIREKIYTLSDKIVVKKLADGYLGIVGQLLNALTSGALFQRPQKTFLDYEYKDVDWSSGVEMWTLTFNASINRTQPWCNKAQQSAMLRSVNCYGYSLKPRYVAGNFELIKSMIMASAAVNVTQPPVEISGQTHVDGGFQYPSPFVPFTENIFELAQTRKIQLVYFSAINLGCGLPAPNSVFENVSWSLENLMNGHIVLEFEHLITLMKSLVGRDLMCKELIGHEGVSNIADLLVNNSHSLIVFSPQYSVEIDYTNFQKNDIDKIVKLVTKSCKINVYY